MALLRHWLWLFKTICFWFWYLRTKGFFSLGGNLHLSPLGYVLIQSLTKHHDEDYPHGNCFLCTFIRSLSWNTDYSFSDSNEVLLLTIILRIILHLRWHLSFTFSFLSSVISQEIKEETFQRCGHRRYRRGRRKTGKTFKNGKDCRIQESTTTSIYNLVGYCIPSGIHYSLSDFNSMGYELRHAHFLMNKQDSLGWGIPSFGVSTLTVKENIWPRYKFGAVT